VANPPVTAKSATRTGSGLLRMAKDLAASAQRLGLPSRNRIYNGYVLRGLKIGKAYQGQVIDLPMYLWYAGTATYTPGGAFQLIENACVPAGNRDDITAPGTEVEIQIGDSAVLRLLSPLSPDNALDPIVRYIHMQPKAWGPYRTMGWLWVPLINDRYTSFDVLESFTFAQIVKIAMSYTIPSKALTKVTNAVPNDYLALNTFWITERQLPEGWAFLQRRIISDSYYDTSTPAGDYRYKDYLMPMSHVPAGDVILAEEDADQLIDRYCVTAQVYNQYRGTYYWGNPAETSGSNAKLYYDRQGEHAVAIMTGELDRTTYDPESPEQLYAELVDVKLFRITDMPEDWRPRLTIPQGLFTRPETPAYAWFELPRPVRSTDGFTVFVNFMGFYFADPDSAPSEAEYAGYYPTYQQRDYWMWATLIIDPEGKGHVLRGDKDGMPAVDPVPPTAEAAYVAVPWVVGVESVPRTDAEGVIQRTAYALAWEEQWVRQGVAWPHPVSVDDVNNGISFLGSRSLGGRWALYSLETGSPERIEIESDCAPLISPQISTPSTFPQFSQNRNWPDIQQHASHASLYYAGDEKFVFPAISNEYHRVWATFDNSSAQAVTSRRKFMDEHEIYCAVLDLVTNQIERRGVITTRSSSDINCHITVAQSFVAGVDDLPGMPAVLLASIFDVSVETRGYQPQFYDSPVSVHVSVDGGMNWRPYVTDQSAPNGAFPIGNQFWTLNLDERIDEKSGL
jgi:hypothetical protein